MPVWRETVVKYKRPNHLKSGWQILNTLPPFFGLWYLMYLSLFQSYWITLLLAVPTAGVLVRIFTIQHDCGHRSFFRSPRANDLLGSLCGILTITPYHHWRRTHTRHHVTSGNLSHRGHGDVGVLTVEEYLARSRWGRFRYRLHRHPLNMFFLGATFQFVVVQRLTYGTPRSWRRERRSVYLTNLGILAILGVAWWDRRADRLLPGPRADHGHCRCRRELALFRSASVRRCLLGAEQDVGLLFFSV